jgi:small subunit ribosomal protein S1
MLEKNAVLEIPTGDEKLWDELEGKDNTTHILKWTSDLNFEELNSYEKTTLQNYENGGIMSEISPINEGNVVEGVIKQMSRKEVVIDVNYKDFVYVENTSTDWKFLKNLKIEDKIKVLISKINYKPSFKIIGSISDLIKIDVENQIGNIFKENLPLSAKAISKNSAGFMLKLDIKGIEYDAFMPNTIASSNKLTDYQADKLIGKNIMVCLETLREDKGLYVVSRKKYLKLYQFPEELSKIKKGETIYKGHITGTTPFGVFVEFNNCLTGMIHKVNINPNYSISDYKPGMVIEFYIKDILKNGKEIILTQILRESLWDNLKVNDIYEGSVIAVKNFGVLVKLDEETFGLIQNSYLRKANVNLSVKDKVKVRIVSFIKDDRKIYLDVVK